jgi:hypothetical protein
MHGIILFHLRGHGRIGRFFGTRLCTSINTRINLPALDPLARRVVDLPFQAAEFEGGLIMAARSSAMSKADPTCIDASYVGETSPDDRRSEY